MTASPIAARPALADESFMTRLCFLIWADRCPWCIASQDMFAEHDLFRKPVSTFRDHALIRQSRFDHDVVRNAFGIAELDGDSTFQSLPPHAAIGQRVIRPDIEEGDGNAMPIERPLFHRR